MATVWAAIGGVVLGFWIGVFAMFLAFARSINDK